MTLQEICNKHGSDKGNTAFEAHNYAPLYEDLLNKYDPLRLLEIGIWDPRFPGASPRAWHEWKPTAKLFGLDIAPDAKSLETQCDMTVFIADQNNPEQLRSVMREMGKVDVIIDDGSHFLPHIVTSLMVLWPAVVDGGLYIIEDLHAPQSQPRFSLDEVVNDIGAVGKWFCDDKLLVIRK